ncbi:hypothetical protein J7T55_007611 [Diaporthe amygdali]|uniref:uncharacterized protein n=1 Tax=Phomopsis amygdali TaxID=1214568 RepID=UPI0022FEDF40|nr:uncharacterized protein J7T55_007611 [Diaporthe amygdali]KAJ0107241.1 hypothetical protein J7T55_007611 [Diaporthe amygdali]
MHHIHHKVEVPVACFELNIVDFVLLVLPLQTGLHKARWDETQGAETETGGHLEGSIASLETEPMSVRLQTRPSERPRARRLGEDDLAQGKQGGKATIWMPGRTAMQ